MWVSSHMDERSCMTFADARRSYCEPVGHPVHATQETSR